MNKIIQCVPNFSEGTRLEVVEKIVDELKDKLGVHLVSYEPDADYNRTVVTLIGEPESIVKALIPFVGKALELIDMNYQSGEHPRMGAVDVIPFIPIENVTMDECIEYANTLGSILYDTYSIPSFLYAKAAKKKDRISLPNIRKGEFEGMKEKIKDPNWTPDYGTNKIHPTFGVVGIGARIPLIAYNIDLDTNDLSIAKTISKAIRHSSGGFRHIQAGPVYLESRGHVQVTMNILDYKKNPIYRILETVKMEAKRYHVNVPSCELVGLIPKQALINSLKYYLECNDEELKNNISFEEIVTLTKQYMAFRDFDKYKIIEANIK
jgi:glutamate formiminotransferase